MDESAITGESAPVVRESGGDFCSVTGGTTVVSDWLKIRITSDPGNSFLDRMIALVEGASRKKTPNEIALNTLLVSLTIIFLIVIVTLYPIGVYSGVQLQTSTLIALTGLPDPHHHRRPAVRHRHRGHGPCHPLQRHCHVRQGSGGLRRRGYHDSG